MKKLKKKRLEKDLSQIEIPAEAGLKQPIISILERGYKNEDISGFKRLCNYFELTEQEALEDVEVERDKYAAR